MINKISVSTKDFALQYNSCQEVCLRTEKISLGNLNFAENFSTAHKNLFLFAVFAKTIDYKV